TQVQVSRLEKKILGKMKDLIKEREEPNMAAKGNREEAIRLLKETELTLKEIHKITGVPQGTMGSLSKIHRPKEIAEANRRKGVEASIQARKENREAKVEDNITLDDVTQADCNLDEETLVESAPSVVTIDSLAAMEAAAMEEETVQAEMEEETEMENNIF